MSSVSKVPFLVAIAKRYALRHRGQTVRAVFGLLVITTVLTIGLGLGDSIATSLEQEALAQFGAIDVQARRGQPFELRMEDRLERDARVAPFGVTTAANLELIGAVTNADAGLAEAFARVRGARDREAAAFGPLRDLEGNAVPEPRPGQAYVSERLADRLDVTRGTRLTVAVQQPNAFPDAQFSTVNLTGVSGVPPPVGGHAVEVAEGAVGLGAGVSWVGDPGPVTLTATSPSGTAFANTSAEAPVRLTVPAPLEAGTWTVTVEAGRPTPYFGIAGVVYPPAELQIPTVRLNLTVAGVVQDGGRAGVGFRPTLVVAYSELVDALGLGDVANVVSARVTGDPYGAVDAMDEALAAGNIEGVNVRAVKADALADAAEAGRGITGFLLVMGGFTILAALLLAFTLFTAIVEERRAELGVSRALGLTRGEVAFAMFTEGALYTFASAVAGLLLGGVLLLGLVALISGVSEREGGPDFGLHVGPEAVIAALVLGTLAPLATILFASLRFARLDPARAMRGTTEDPSANRRATMVLSLLIFGLGASLSFTPVGRLVGVPLMLAGAAGLLAGTGWTRVAFVPALAGIVFIAWSLYSFESWPEGRGELDPITTMARGAVLALGLATLVAATPSLLRGLARLLARFPSTRLSAFVALRYLSARRLAAGTTMGMIALVVVVVTVMGTLFFLFSGQIPSDEAGYQVLGESALVFERLPRPLPADVAAQVDRYDFVPQHRSFVPFNLTRDGEPVSEFGSLRSWLGVTQGFAEHNAYTLAARADAFGTDEAAWLAVAAGEAVIMPDWIGRAGDVKVGDTLSFKREGTQPRVFVVAGTVRSEFVRGTFGSAEYVRSLGFPQSTTIALRVVDGGDPDEVAHRLTSEYAESGLSFTSIPEEARAIAGALQGVLLVFQAFLSLGLFVGLSSTGFLASRAVHERRREIGTLRALGFEERDVKRAFMLESVATAATGLLIGAVVGVTVAHSVWWRDIRDEGLAFTAPWLLIAGFALAVVVLAALAARGPAQRASRVAPAIAVRHVE